MGFSASIFRCLERASCSSLNNSFDRGHASLIICCISSISMEPVPLFWTQQTPPSDLLRCSSGPSCTALPPAADPRQKSRQSCSASRNGPIFDPHELIAEGSVFPIIALSSPPMPTRCTDVNTVSLSAAYMAIEMTSGKLPASGLEDHHIDINDPNTLSWDDAVLLELSARARAQETRRDLRRLHCHTLDGPYIGFCRHGGT